MRLRELHAAIIGNPSSCIFTHYRIRAEFRFTGEQLTVIADELLRGALAESRMSGHQRTSGCHY